MMGNSGLAAVSLWQVGVGLFAGVGLGLFYFGLLWWTTNRLTSTGNPALLFVLSFLLRSTVVLGLFYWLIVDGVVRGLVALIGFWVARHWLIDRLGPNTGPSNQLQAESLSRLKAD